MPQSTESALQQSVRRRLAALREKRGWSLNEAAERCGVSVSTVQKLEKGPTELTLGWIETLATVYDVPVADLLGMSPGGVGPLPQLKSDLAPYDIPAKELSILTRDAVSPAAFRVLTDALSELGVAPGDILIFDRGREVTAAARAPTIVMAEMAITPGSDVMVILLRQFIEPALLITNARTGNAPSLHLEADPVRITGVLLFQVRDHGRPMNGH